MQFYNACHHFKTITQHKLTVMDLCFKVGLVRQGFLHDLSKYSPEEFLTGVRYYQGNRSPNAAEKEEVGYSAAWLHHKGRNKHHFEYWMDYSTEIGKGVVGAKMPLRYVLEMTCDRIAASKIYRGSSYTDADPWNYYCRRKNELIMHNETRMLLEKLLILLRDKGEHLTLSYMRWLLLHPWVYDGKVYSVL
jgi:hypothetical protein